MIQADNQRRGVWDQSFLVEAWNQTNIIKHTKAWHFFIMPSKLLNSTGRKHGLLSLLKIWLNQQQKNTKYTKLCKSYKKAKITGLTAFKVLKYSTVDFCPKNEKLKILTNCDWMLGRFIKINKLCYSNLKTKIGTFHIKTWK